MPRQAEAMEAPIWLAEPDCTVEVSLATRLREPSDGQCPEPVVLETQEYESAGWVVSAQFH